MADTPTIPLLTRGEHRWLTVYDGQRRLGLVIESKPGIYAFDRDERQIPDDQGGHEGRAALTAGTPLPETGERWRPSPRHRARTFPHLGESRFRRKRRSTIRSNRQICRFPSPMPRRIDAYIGTRNPAPWPIP